MKILGTVGDNKVKRQVNWINAWAGIFIVDINDVTGIIGKIRMFTESAMCFGDDNFLMLIIVPGLEEKYTLKYLGHYVCGLQSNSSKKN